MFRVTNEFQTQNRFNQVRTGPHDDLEMLCNFMFWLTNNHSMLDLKYPAQTFNDSEQRLFFMKEYKRSYPLQMLSKHLKKQDHSLHHFCIEVEKFKYNK